jgi:hypothetical protein
MKKINKTGRKDEIISNVQYSVTCVKELKIPIESGVFLIFLGNKQRARETQVLAQRNLLNKAIAYNRTRPASGVHTHIHTPNRAFDF